MVWCSTVDRVSYNVGTVFRRVVIKLNALRCVVYIDVPSKWRLDPKCAYIIWQRPIGRWSGCFSLPSMDLHTRTLLGPLLAKVENFHQSTFDMILAWLKACPTGDLKNSPVGDKVHCWWMCNDVQVPCCLEMQVHTHTDTHEERQWTRWNWNNRLY